MGLFGVVEEIRHKNGEFLYGALRVSDIPPVAPRCSGSECDTTRTVAHHTGSRVVALFTEGRTRIVLLAGAPVTEEDRRFISEVDPPSGSHAARL